ncbi:MAG: hypothetical protein Q8J76_00180, partial [Desulfobulbaceae bacterium]|nr:hypothetical protein [Desulfobulbaceae bacterium]
KFAFALWAGKNFQQFFADHGGLLEEKKKDKVSCWTRNCSGCRFTVDSNWVLAMAEDTLAMILLTVNRQLNTVNLCSYLDSNIKGEGLVVNI